MISYRGIGFCGLSCLTRGRGYDLLGAFGSASCDITHETGVRFIIGIGFCVIRYHLRDKRYELLRALGSVSCDIIDEPGKTSCCYGH